MVSAAFVWDTPAENISKGMVGDTLGLCFSIPIFETPIVRNRSGDVGASVSCKLYKISPTNLYLAAYVVDVIYVIKSSTTKETMFR